jgi:hypothetical protein
MQPMRRTICLTLVCSTLLAIGCTRSNELPPLTTASTAKPAYATRYADSLAATRGSIGQQENKANRTMGEMSQFTSAIEAKDWHQVRTVYQLADAAGRSSDYAERHEQNDAVTTFFEEEKQDIQNGLVGSAQYAAKQNTCKDPNQVGSSALYGFNKAVEKSLQDRMRERDEAHDFISAHQSALGDKAVEKLREQADKISETSFIVYVGVEQNRRKLQVLVKESNDIKKTLQRAAEQDASLSSDATQPEADRKAAQARATAENESLAKADAEVQQAQHVLNEFDERAKKLRTDYEQALKALLDAADAKSKGAQH